MHAKQNENKYRPKTPPTKQIFKDSTSKSLRYILKIPIICFLLQAVYKLDYCSISSGRTSAKAICSDLV